MTMAHGVALVMALILNATANLLIKFGMQRLAAEPAPKEGLLASLMPVVFSPYLIVGAFCFAANLAFYAYALKAMKISVAYPIMVTVGFAIIVTIAGWRLGERLTGLQWGGIALIMIGVVLVATHAGSQLGDEVPLPPVAQSGIDHVT